MENELPYEEFKDYYQEVSDFLQKSYQEMKSEELLAARFILDIVSSNSKVRAARKGPEYKKYKKMAEKCSFWSAAINLRLEKAGMTPQQIDEELARLSQEE